MQTDAKIAVFRTNVKQNCAIARKIAIMPT